MAHAFEQLEKAPSSLAFQWIYLTFFAVFQLGSLLCAVATSSNMFIAARAIAGAGGSGLVSGGFYIISYITPIKQRPSESHDMVTDLLLLTLSLVYLGLVSANFALGTVVGPLIGGAFAENVSWRWCFYINLPIGALTAIGLLIFFHPPTRPIEQEKVLERVKKLDFVGAIIFMAAVIMVLLALQWGGNTYPWKSATIIGLFCGFGAVLLLFAAWEVWLGDNAMIPPAIMMQRTVLWGALTISLFNGSAFVVIYYLPEWFQVIKDASPVKSGVMNLPLFISQMIGTLSAGILSSKIGYCNPFAIIGGSLISIATGLESTFKVSTGHAAWIGYQVLNGLGIGMSIQIPVIAIQPVLSLAQAPVGMAIVIFFQFFGSSIFLAVAQTSFTNSLIKEIGRHAHGVSAQALLNAGSAGVRDIVGPEDLPGVLIAYNNAIRTTFYVALGIAVPGVLTSLGMEWKNIRNHPTEAAKSEQGGEGLTEAK